MLKEWAKKACLTVIISSTVCNGLSSALGSSILPGPDSAFQAHTSKYKKQSAMHDMWEYCNVPDSSLKVTDIYQIADGKRYGISERQATIEERKDIILALAKAVKQDSSQGIRACFEAGEMAQRDSSSVYHSHFTALSGIYSILVNYQQPASIVLSDLSVYGLTSSYLSFLQTEINSYLPSCFWHSESSSVTAPEAHLPVPSQKSGTASRGPTFFFRRAEMPEPLNEAKQAAPSPAPTIPVSQKSIADSFLAVIKGLYPTLPTGTLHRFPPLSDEDMGASFGTSGFHDPRMKERIPQFHRDGEQWSDDALQEYFLKGIFQHYLPQFTGYDKTYDYAYLGQSRVSKYDQRKISELLAKSLEGNLSNDQDRQVSLTRSLANLFTKATEILQTNPIFVQLGINYHRSKAQLERLQSFLEKEKSEQGKEVIVNETYALDRINQDLQVSFFNWMEAYFSLLQDNIKSSWTHHKSIPSLTQELETQLKEFEPAFMSQEPYSSLKLIKRYKAPNPNMQF